MPGRDHHGLDCDWCHRRASDPGGSPAVLRRLSESCARRRDLGGTRVPGDHGRSDRRRRDGPQAVCHPAPGRRRAPDRPTAAVLPDALSPVHRRAQRVVAVDAAAVRRRPGRAAGGRDARRAEADHRGVADRRSARHRRSEHAHRRISPPRAGGASGDDADPGRGHRRRVGDRRRSAAAVRARPAIRASS